MTEGANPNREGLGTEALRDAETVHQEAHTVEDEHKEHTERQEADLLRTTQGKQEDSGTTNETHRSESR